MYLEKVKQGLNLELAQECTTFGFGLFPDEDLNLNNFHVPFVNTPGICKERYKTRSVQEIHKVWQGVSCVDACLSAPLVQVSPVLLTISVLGDDYKCFGTNLGKPGFKSKGGFHFEGGLCPTLQNEASSHQSLIGSEYVDLMKNRYFKEALLALLDMVIIEKVVAWSSQAFYNHLFLVPKPNNKWRPILDLSQLNLYLNPGTFKMETPETIRFFLQKGEWVTSLDFNDAYFHIPINHRSMKYLRFYLNKHTNP